MGRGERGGVAVQETRLGTSQARTQLPDLVKKAAAKTEPSSSLLEDAIEIGSYRRGGALLIPAVDAQAHLARAAELESLVEELEAEVEDLRLARLLEERISNRDPDQPGKPIEQVARELGFGHLLDGG